MKTNQPVDYAALQPLKDGKLVVLPTDTIYGVVADAMNMDAVERLYKVRRRSPNKPFIVLIGESAQLQAFPVRFNDAQRRKALQNWPGPVSVEMEYNDPKDEFGYLHLGLLRHAFRVPANEALRSLLRQTGPLVAPSANLEGKPPATTVDEARSYFGDAVDTYIDGGKIVGRPSKLIRIDPDGSEHVLRP